MQKLTENPKKFLAESLELRQEKEKRIQETLKKLLNYDSEKAMFNMITDILFVMVECHDGCFVEHKRFLCELYDFFHDLVKIQEGKFDEIRMIA